MSLEVMTKEISATIESVVEIRKKENHICIIIKRRS